jgi:hypothetical protein
VEWIGSLTQGSEPLWGLVFPQSRGCRPDDGGSKHLWNVGQFLRDDTAQHHRRPVIFILAAVRTWNLTSIKLHNFPFTVSPRTPPSPFKPRFHKIARMLWIQYYIASRPSQVDCIPFIILGVCVDGFRKGPVTASNTVRILDHLFYLQK